MLSCFCALCVRLPQSIKVLNMVKLYGKAIRINKASQDKTNSGDVGANLFIGNLDPDVDEKVGQDGYMGQQHRECRAGTDPWCACMRNSPWQADPLACACMLFGRHLVC